MAFFVGFRFSLIFCKIHVPEQDSVERLGQRTKCQA